MHLALLPYWWPSLSALYRKNSIHHHCSKNSTAPLQPGSFCYTHPFNFSHPILGIFPKRTTFCRLWTGVSILWLKNQSPLSCINFNYPTSFRMIRYFYIFQITLSSWNSISFYFSLFLSFQINQHIRVGSTERICSWSTNGEENL